MKWLPPIVLHAAILLPRVLWAQPEGSLRDLLARLPLPGARSESFRVPTGESVAAFRTVVETALEGNYARAAELAAPLGYSFTRFADSATGRTYSLLLDQQAQGQGTYVFRPEACRRLVFQAPHAGGDTNTGPQSIDLFLRLDAAALFLPGTHRCANAEPSPCEGTTSICTGSEQRYPVSDVAHFTRSYFQAAHEATAQLLDNAIFVQMHGFTWQAGDPDLIISNATCRNLPLSIATQLAQAYNQTFTDANISLSAGSCNAAGGPTRLCAESNVQARNLAGALDPCSCAGGGSTCAAGSSCPPALAYPERFLHIEQSCATRQFTTCARPGRFTYEQTAQVFERFFPCAPRIRSIVHAASFEQEALAPGTLFSLFGEYIPVRARLSACGAEAAVLYNSGGQVNAVLPERQRDEGPCPVRVTLDEPVPFVSNTVSVLSVEQAIALFQHEGLAIITRADGTLVNQGAPARPGEAVVLWGTGGGLANSPAPLATLVRRPAVAIDGVEAAVQYAGRAPGFAGLDQINITVPMGTARGKRTLAINERVHEIWVE